MANDKFTLMDFTPRSERASRLATLAVKAGDRSAEVNGRAVWSPADLRIALEVYCRKEEK